MKSQIPQLTESRRAGLLAAVAVYPLSRLSGTLPRPALDQALVSGTAMGLAFAVTSTSTAVVRRAVGGGSPLERNLRGAAVLSAVAVGTSWAAVQVRRRARRAATSSRRLPIEVGALGAASEILTLTCAAGAAVSAADLVGELLPGGSRQAHPMAVAAQAVLAGGAAAMTLTRPRVLAYFALPDRGAAPAHGLTFQPGSNLPDTIGRAAGVAVTTLAAISVELRVADQIAVYLAGPRDITFVGRTAAHAVAIATFTALSGAGLGLYLLRYVVQNRVHEAAYAAVPTRDGVTGGPQSAYSFDALGREGRRFVSQAYTAEELAAVLGEPAVDPVRALIPEKTVSGDLDRDAAAVVAELERIGGFEKGTIVLAVPTGDGYVSYVQTETVELLTRGDCATVLVPYAQIPSTWAFFAVGRAAAASYSRYARALSDRARELGRAPRLCIFGESLGSIVALDAFEPEPVAGLQRVEFLHGLFLGVPKYSHVDRALRPRGPGIPVSHGLQYAANRNQALGASPGHLVVTHWTDPLALADVSELVRHPVDYWGRPAGVHVPVVSFLIELIDVKNAMTLRPGDFPESPGHDYRYETAAAVARAYDLPFDAEVLVEHALREREVAWSVRRLLARRFEQTRESVRAQLQSWGVDPDTIATRFASQRQTLNAWITPLSRTDTGAVEPVVDTLDGPPDEKGVTLRTRAADGLHAIGAAMRRRGRLRLPGRKWPAAGDSHGA